MVSIASFFVSHVADFVLRMFELILKNIARFVTLTPEEIDDFTAQWQLKKLRRRQYLIQAGDPCRYECFVNKGCLRQYYVDESGQEHVLLFAVEDYWFSDMYGLVTGEAAVTNIDALEDTELLIIDRKAYEELLLRIPKLERFFRIILQRSIITQQRRIIENLSLSAEQRYQNFVDRFPSLLQRVSQKQIASYLGITPESLSRIHRQRQQAKKS